MNSFHTEVFEDDVLKYQHSGLWRGKESLYKYSEPLRPSESNTENKILHVVWERCSEQTIYLRPACFANGHNTINLGVLAFKLHNV